MNNLVLCHVTESVTTKQLKLFLRAFHRSGLLSNSDLLFLFDSPNSAPDYFNNVILQENDFFLKVIQAGLMCNGSKPVSDFATSFNLNRFDNMEKREIIWGRRIIRSNNNNNPSLHDCRVSYGSVVGFGVGELDPENSLSGFMDRVPIGFRRWAAYPMILGRVRRHYKHVMLVDVRKVLLLGDPLGRVKTQSPDSVFLVSTNEKNINPAVIMGGTRGIRRLSVAMLMEIVRASMRNKRNNVVNESSLLRHLSTNEFTLRRIHIFVTLVVEESELGGFSIANQTIVWRENNGADIDTVVMKRIVRFL